ncbi:MAG: glycogen/starch synthase, partial [Candidatus Omnitrophota bacterium]
MHKIISVLDTPHTGYDLISLLGLNDLEDILSVYKICKSLPDIECVFAGESYLRIKQNGSISPRLSPSILRSFLDYEVIGRKGDARISGHVKDLNARRHKVSKDKYSMAQAWVEEALDKLPRKDGITCFISGDVALGMAHRQPRAESFTGELVKGSDLDIIVVTDTGSISAEEIDNSIYKIKCMALKLSNEELDYIIKPFSKVAEYTSALNPNYAIPVKIILDSQFLCGDRGLYEKVRRVIEESRWPEIINNYLIEAKKQRETIRARILKEALYSWDDDLYTEFLGDNEQFDFNTRRPRPVSYPGTLPITQEERNTITQENTGNLLKYINETDAIAGGRAVVLLADRGGRTLVEIDITGHRMELDMSLAARAPPFDKDDPLSRSFQILINDIIDLHEYRGHILQNTGDEELACQPSYEYYRNNPEELIQLLRAFKSFGIQLNNDYLSGLNEIIEEKSGVYSDCCDMPVETISCDEIIKVFKINNPYYEEAGIEFIRNIYSEAKTEYKDGQFPDGESYIHHASLVAFTVACWGADAMTIAISLLHKISENRLADLLGEMQAVGDIELDTADELYKAVAKLHRSLPYLERGVETFGTENTLQNYMNFVLQLAEGDHRITMHTFADQIQSIYAASREDKRILKKKILHVYAPLTGRLIHRIYTVMRNRAFELSQPEECRRIKEAINAAHDIDYDTLEQATTPLRKDLSNIVKANDPEAEVIHKKKKGLYAIYEKATSTRRKGYNGVEDIEDLIGLMVITERVNEVSGAILSYLNASRIPAKSEWKFRRDKGYEAVHINFYDKTGPWEIMLMTPRDYGLYRFGLYEQYYAVGPLSKPHWIYKLEGELKAEGIRQVFKADEVAMTEDFVANSRKLYEHINRNIYVCVIRPSSKGRVLYAIELPKGAYPVDLALHPQINADINSYNGFSIVSFSSGASRDSQFKITEELLEGNPLSCGMVLILNQERAALKVEVSDDVSKLGLLRRNLDRKHNPADLISLNRNAQLLRSKLLLKIAIERKNIRELAGRGKQQIEAELGRVLKTEKLSQEIFEILNKFTLLKGLRLEYIIRQEYDRSELYAAVAIGVIVPAEVVDYCTAKTNIDLNVFTNNIEGIDFKIVGFLTKNKFNFREISIPSLEKDEGFIAFKSASCPVHITDADIREILVNIAGVQGVEIIRRPKDPARSKSRLPLTEEQVIREIIRKNTRALSEREYKNLLSVTEQVKKFLRAANREHWIPALEELLADQGKLRAGPFTAFFGALWQDIFYLDESMLYDPQELTLTLLHELGALKGLTHKDNLRLEKQFIIKGKDLTQLKGQPTVAGGRPSTVFGPGSSSTLLYPLRGWWGSISRAAGANKFVKKSASYLRLMAWMIFAFMGIFTVIPLNPEEGPKAGADAAFQKAPLDTSAEEVERLRSLLKLLIEGKDWAGLEKLILDYEHTSGYWHLYPVESRWPILKAAALLSKEDQAAFVKFLESKTRLLRLPLVDSLLLMFKKAVPADWLKRFAHNLAGRTIYTVAAEGWHAAGGLGRVQQYHSSAMKGLVGEYAEVATIEPYYAYRLVNADGGIEEINYRALPGEIQGLTDNPAYEFTVMVKGRPVEAQVFTGVNERGIKIYLIKDKANHSTRIIYGYGQQGTGTWEEFTEFFSRAALELIRQIESSKQARAANKAYRSPVIIANDGQLAPLVLFKRQLDEVDETLQDALVWMTTHTYRNRGVFDESRGHRVLAEMGVEEKWRPYFLRIGQIDFTSVGLRLADGANAVSAIHRDEVAHIDPTVTLLAITNGDERDASCSEFQKLFCQADSEYCTPGQVFEAKREAKLKQGLNPEQMVISYSGRLVSEKAGRQRAFTDDNIEALVKSGVQVVIYGNLQANEESKNMSKDLKALEERLNNAKSQNPGGYPGRLIVKTAWGISEQRALLAATDIQVQDSDRATGAAEYTEADVSANAGLQFGPAWTEGIIQRQGIVLDRNIPGSGNTLVPSGNTPKDYLETFLWAVNLYQKEPLEFSSYQATSVRLSRILEALLPAAEYLRQFSRAMERKENPEQLLLKFIEGDAYAAQYFSNIHGRENLLRYLNKNPSLAVPLRSNSEKIKVYSLRMDPQPRIVAMNLEGFKAESKTWALVSSRESFKAL